MDGGAWAAGSRAREGCFVETPEKNVDRSCPEGKLVLDFLPSGSAARPLLGFFAYGVINV